MDHPVSNTEHVDLSHINLWVGKQAVYRDEGLWLVEVRSVRIRDVRLTISLRTIPYPDRTKAARQIDLSADISQVHVDKEQCFGVNLSWHIDASREAVRALRAVFDELPGDLEKGRARQLLWAAYQRHYSEQTARSER